MFKAKGISITLLRDASNDKPSSWQCSIETRMIIDIFYNHLALDRLLFQANKLKMAAGQWNNIHHPGCIRLKVTARHIGLHHL